MKKFSQLKFRLRVALSAVHFRCLHNSSHCLNHHFFLIPLTWRIRQILLYVQAAQTQCATGKVKLTYCFNFSFFKWQKWQKHRENQWRQMLRKRLRWHGNRKTHVPFTAKLFHPVKSLFLGSFLNVCRARFLVLPAHRL